MLENDDNIAHATGHLPGGVVTFALIERGGKLTVLCALKDDDGPELQSVLPLMQAALSDAKSRSFKNCWGVKSGSAEAAIVGIETVVALDGSRKFAFSGGDAKIGSRSKIRKLFGLKTRKGDSFETHWTVDDALNYGLEHGYEIDLNHVPSVVEQQALDLYFALQESARRQNAALDAAQETGLATVPVSAGCAHDWLDRHGRQGGQWCRLCGETRTAAQEVSA